MTTSSDVLKKSQKYRFLVKVSNFVTIGSSSLKKKKKNVAYMFAATQGH